jgi:hypothetical protein
MIEPEMCAIATPFPLLWPEFHRRSNGVQVDVPSINRELAIRDDRHALETISEQMTRMAMLLVPITRVFSKELPHSFRQVPVSNLEQKMKVIRHLAVAENRPTKLPRHTGKQHEVTNAILLAHEDGTAVIAPRRNVVDATRLYDARRSRHASTIGTADWLGRQRHTFGTQLAQFSCGV